MLIELEEQKSEKDENLINLVLKTDKDLIAKNLELKEEVPKIVNI
jgi:hypothetical protein